MRWIAVSLLLLISKACSAQEGHPADQFSVYCSTGQSAIVGDAFWSGRVGVAKRAALGRLDVKASRGVGTSFRVAGVDETPFLEVSSSGWVGLGVSPRTDLDISGVGDGWWPSLALNNNNLGSTNGRYQIAFGAFGSTNFRHVVRTSIGHGAAGNNLDFLLWTPAAGAMFELAKTPVFSIHTRRNGSTLQIRPVGFSDADLVVSDGMKTGGGMALRRHEVVPADNDELMDVSYLDGNAAERAYGEEKGIRHVVSAGGGLRPVFDSVPQGMRRSEGFISLDARITEAELAAQELIRRLEKAEVEASALGNHQ